MGDSHLATAESRKAEVKPQNTLNTPTLVSVAVSVQ
jgi:hypothetical protein